MKLYKVEVNRDGSLGIAAIDATETPTTYEIEAESAARAWFYKRSLSKQHDWRMIHLSPQEAVEAFIDLQIGDRDQAISRLDAMQRFLLKGACEQRSAEQLASADTGDRSLS